MIMHRRKDLNMIGGNLDIQTFLKYFARIATLLLVLPLHESAHGLMAKWLGDDTAQRQGRISLNPFVHLDPFGSILMVLGGFGWAKPVEVNPTRFKNYRAGYAMTALAGPVSNLLASFVSALAFAIILCFRSGQEAYIRLITNQLDTMSCLLMLLQFLIIVNIGLALFNLIPVPPLDGFNILRAFIPEKCDRWVYQHQREITYVFFALFLLMNFVPTQYSPLARASEYLYRLMMKAVLWIPDTFGA